MQEEKKEIPIICLMCGNLVAIKKEGLYDIHFGVPNLFDIACCPSCGFEQTTPQPTPQELKQFYEEYYNFGGERGTVYTRLREWFFSSFFYRLWLYIDGDVSFHGIKGEGRLLDVGCNEGRGLQIYQKNGFDAEGLEINENAAKVAREKGFTVHICLIEDFQPKVPYDVVVLSNVLEHVFNPKEVIYNIRRVLKPGGELWISCPNTKSWFGLVFGRKWVNWHVPFHISHFSEFILCQLLEDAGFRVIKSKSETPSLIIAQSIICSLFSIRGRPTVQIRNPFLIGPLMLLVRATLFPFLYLLDLLGKGGDLVVISSRS
ncbi:MAG: class I SAM-dependent methyltransferase [Deltaproteobacteria bacterium]|nr:class I SAM-dependent methyltransferase [Deltaproteobacteria bacterium]